MGVFKEIEKADGSGVTTFYRLSDVHDTVETDDSEGTATVIDYNAAQNKPSVNGVALVGNKTSEDLGLQPAGDYITNDEADAKFIDEDELEAYNYVNETQLQEAIANIDHFHREIVAALPVTGQDNVLYLVRKEGSGEDIYNEYIWVGRSYSEDGYEFIGTTATDLTDYYQKSEVNALLNNKVDKVDGKGLSEQNYTLGEKTKLAGLHNYDDTELQVKVANLHNYDDTDLQLRIGDLEVKEEADINAISTIQDALDKKMICIRLVEQGDGWTWMDINGSRLTFDRAQAYLGQENCMLFVEQLENDGKVIPAEYKSETTRIRVLFKDLDSLVHIMTLGEEDLLVEDIITTEDGACDFEVENEAVDFGARLDEFYGNTSQEVIAAEAGTEVVDTSISINDVNTDKENYITLKGNTYQYTTTGKNLCSGIILQNTYICPCSVGDKFTLSLVGRISGNDGRLFLRTYNGEFTPQLDSYVDQTSLTLTATDASYTSTITSTTDGFVYIRTAAGPSNYTLSKVQVERGANATDYEPYTNGVSPNPDYPQRIETVSGDNTIITQNKNLLENTTLTQPLTKFGVTVTPNDDGTFTINGTNTESSTIYFNTHKEFIYPNIAVNQIDSTIKKVTESGYTLWATITSHTGNVSFGHNASNGIWAIGISPGASFDNAVLTLQYEKGNTNTSYVTPEIQTYSINLPVENIATTYNTSGTGYITWNYDNSKVSKKMTYSFIPAFSTTNATIYMRSSSGGTVITAGTIATITANNKASLSFELTDAQLSEIKATTGGIIQVYCSGVAMNENSITGVQLEKGSKANSYTSYGTTPIELCKMGGYQDYFHKKGNNWYVHKEIGKVILNGSEAGWSRQGQPLTNTTRFLSYDVLPGGKDTSQVKIISDKFVNGNSASDNGDYEHIRSASTGFPTVISLNINNNRLATLDAPGFKAWLANNNITVYYWLETPTDTLVTNSTLSSQLDALYNATLYSTTNINTDANDLLPYIDLKYNVVTPSPSPDRPSEVKVVKGNNNIKVYNKNLFDGVLELGNWNTNNGSKLVNTSFIINSHPISVKELTNYKISLENEDIDMYVFEYKKDMSYNLTARKLVRGDSYLTTEEGTAYINFRPMNQNTNLHARIQVEAGTTRTEYVLGRVQTFPLSLGQIELCKIDNYKDKIYKQDDKWYLHKEIGKVVFNGSENWNNAGTSTLTERYSVATPDLQGARNGYCNNNKFVNSGVSLDTQNCGVSGTTFYYRINHGVVGETQTIANFKSWVANNNIIIYTLLLTPTDTEITDPTLLTQLENLQQITQYKHTYIELIPATDNEIPDAQFTYISNAVINASDRVLGKDTYWNDEVPTSADLPSNAQEGEIRIVQDTQNVYIYDGYEWIPFDKGGEVDLSNYLAKDNSTAWVPTGAFNPATKKYVDDSVNGIFVPTKTSQLTNDSNFIGVNSNNLTYYYTKSQTYNKSEVDALIHGGGGGGSSDVQITVSGDTLVITTQPVD